MGTPREDLAERLRHYRLAAGFTSHGALAKRMHVSRSLISKAESPVYPVPTDPVIAGWVETTGAPEDEVEELVKRARAGSPEWFMPYESEEAKAHTLRCWSGPGAVSGLFQTDGYARAILSGQPYTPERLDELVRARMKRKDVIGRAYITAVMDHHVLHRLVGSPRIMAEQCAQLAILAEHPRIAFHVTPEGMTTGTFGALDLATRDNTTMVCMTTMQDMTTTAADMVAKAMETFDRILGAAMPRAGSLDFIRAMEELWKTRI
jgi:transcriptional regulator with XRE-family HTH domain